jgi:hypothetical protein
MGWAVVGMWVGDETSSRAFVELGEYPACEGLKRPADAVLTGKR